MPSSGSRRNERQHHFRDAHFSSLTSLRGREFFRGARFQRAHKPVDLARWKRAPRH